MAGSNGISAPLAVRVDHLDHFFGEGEFRNQVLFNITTEIAPLILDAGRELSHRLGYNE